MADIHVMSDEIRDKMLDKSPSDDRLTPERIDAVIDNVRYIVAEPTSTIAVLTLVNGFVVIGHSACADPANFNEALGKKISLDDAKKQIWPLEGYLLKQRLWEREQNPNVMDTPA